MPVDPACLSSSAIGLDVKSLGLAAAPNRLFAARWHFGSPAALLSAVAGAALRVDGSAAGQSLG